MRDTAHARAEPGGDRVDLLYSCLADPCVGVGATLARLKTHLGSDGETFGVELSCTHTKQAQQVIDVVLPASFYHVKWADRTVSLTLDNPPYDSSEYIEEHGHHIHHGRLFVAHLTCRLSAGGIHPILILRRLLADEELSGRYERVLAFGYPYSPFDQVVVVAVKRAAYVHPACIQMPH